MKKIKNWILLSSTNPAEVSRTVKSFLLLLAPIGMYFLGLTETQYGDVISDISTVIALALSVVFLVLKIINTLFGMKY